MKSCFLCGQPTKVPCYDFCEKCFNLTIEEIEERYLGRGGNEIRQEAKPQGDTSRVKYI